jgi:tRNA (Thr-GGU) A37 N-methylase
VWRAATEVIATIQLRVEGLEAIDGKPIIGIKPVLERGCDS